MATSIALRPSSIDIGIPENVKGPMFQTLHVMFEAQYNELWLASRRQRR